MPKPDVNKILRELECRPLWELQGYMTEGPVRTYDFRFYTDMGTEGYGYDDVRIVPSPHVHS